MDNERFEDQLRQVPLGMPDPEVKRRVMRLALSKARARRRGRVLRWAFAAAAGLLIIINLAFGQIHQRHIAQITGRPGYTQPTSGVAYAEGLEQRERMMSDLLGNNGS